MRTAGFYTAALTLTLALAPQASAQHDNMQGHNMGDMQTMMNHCAQLRQQRRPGARMSPDMERMMVQCDQMDRQMGNMPGGAAPRARTR
jgi:hypothetical protein